MNERQEILDWAAEGRVAPANLPAAMKLAGVTPDAADWREFLDKFLLFGGATLLAAGVVFFFAYNWAELGRFAKFTLLEAGILAALGMVAWFGVDRIAGQAVLLTATLLVGALLAVVGQTYQTGADTYELFATWAALVLPWVLVARFAALWLVWIGLVNFAITFYYQSFGGVFGFMFGPERLLWVHLAFNTAALVAWEILALRGVAWLQQRWSARVVATVAGASATALATFAVFDWRGSGGWAIPAWALWVAGSYAFYRHTTRDLYVLAGDVLAVVIVVASFFAEHLLTRDNAASFLLIGLIVIGLSAAGGWWLNRIAREDRT